MEVLKFSIAIQTDPGKVWTTMLQDKTYRLWTRAFHEGSYYEGRWEKGSEMRFLVLDENGKQQGMYSRIKECVENEFLSIEHLGLISDGAVDTSSEAVKQWAPSFENYTFSKTANGTLLEIAVQMDPQYAEMFEGMWPRALNELKLLCEKG